ncbi:hypothetical protein [Vreelandella populi]|uniref:Uncharacterized protein n=1 Tax=Vreelandella populi TaxID=2498858 RepID=A0A433LFZ4_9GAMM|nr:hypothetical protein [Halomonas populi]RUR48802.1 hypothetical protein ELY37_02830 [Halomonas populi]
MNPNVDWSEAPVDADHWEMTEHGAVWATTGEVAGLRDNGEEFVVNALFPCGDDYAPSFGWPHGQMLDSATPRP